MSEQPPLLVARWLGRQEFEPCLQEQLRIREAVIAGSEPETLLLVEHPPTLTLGRLGYREDILWSDDMLAAAGVAVCETPRGGEVTLHAPGQLICYPIVQVGRRIREHITRLAEVSIEVLGQLGIDGLEFRLENPGVWRGESKLASLGIHVRRGVAIQGIAINLDVDPLLFTALVSCGMPSVEMTSVVRVRPQVLPPMAELAARWAQGFAASAGYRLQ